MESREGASNRGDLLQREPQSDLLNILHWPLGYATCGEGSRVVEVIRNDTKALVTVSLSASSFCECQVKVSNYGK